MKVQPEFFRHYKTVALTMALGVEAPLFVLRLWAHCQSRRTDRFTVNATQLALICEYRGDDPESFADTLINCGFLERQGPITIVHDWAEENAGLFRSWKGGASTKAKWDQAPAKVNQAQASAGASAQAPAQAPARADAIADAKAKPEEAKAIREDKIRLEKREYNMGTTLSSTNGIVHAEAKLWLNGLFQNKGPWSYEEDKLLDELLPIRLEDQRLVTWAYSVPKNHKLHEITMLKHSRLSLLREFGAQVDKFRHVRSMMGLSPEVPEET